MIVTARSAASSPRPANGTSRSRQRHRRVDLVGDDEHAVAGGERRNRRELLRREAGSDRVVRRAEQIGLRPGGEGALERVEIEPPAAGALEEWRLDQPPTDLRARLKMGG